MKKTLLGFIACCLLGIQTSKAQLEILTYASYLTSLQYIYQTSTRGQISPSTHYVYPNSNVTPLGSTTARIKKFSVLFPPRFRARDLDELYGQAMSKHQGADLIIDNKVDTKFTTIFIFQTMTVTLSGTAAHMEVGKQDIGQKDFQVNTTPTNNSQVVVNNTGVPLNPAGNPAGRNDSSAVNGPRTASATQQDQATGQQVVAQQPQTTAADSPQRSTVSQSYAPETVIKEKPRAPSFWIAFHGGLFQPVGKFKKADLKVPLAEAVGAKPGYYVSMELTEYFRSTYGKPVRFGVTQSVGFSATKINFERSYQGEENLSMVDLKSGFILSANVGPGIAADFYFRAGAVSYASTSSFGTAFGTNVRLKWLIGSLSVNTGKLNATNIVGGVSSPAYNIPATSVKLGLGIKLGKA